MEMIDAAPAGSLKALWAIGYDVLLTNPNANETPRALGDLEFIVVQDLFLNETAREFATVFLPAASSFEKDGTFMNSERRVQRVRQAVPAAGRGARPTGRSSARSRAPWAEARPLPSHRPRKSGTKSAPSGRRAAGSPTRDSSGAACSGRVPTSSIPARRSCTPSSFASGPRAALKRIAFTPTAEKTSREFPFLLNTGRTLYQFNAGTMTMRTPNAELRPRDTLDVAPVDAARLGLEDGDLARIRSRRGSAELPVRISPEVKAGELFATFHSADVFLNRVTSAERDNVVATPEYKVTAVSVEKA